MKNTNLKVRLIEAYKSMSTKDLKLLEEWEQASNELEIMDGIK